MRLKSFTAKTMTEAMRMVKETLGEDAVIVSSQEEKGVGVRVTAALEQNDISGFDLGKDDQDDAWLQYDEESDDEDLIAEEITDTLLKHAVPAGTIDIIVSTALNLGLSTPRIALMAALENLLEYTPLPEKGRAKPIMLVGTPGAGKTLAVAKLATRAVVNDQNVAVVTTDVKRAGGVPQLEAFTKLLGVELTKVRKSDDLKTYLQKNESKYDQILIDMPGINPFDAEDMRELASFIGCANIWPILVNQAGIDSDEAAEIAKAYSILGVQTILPTRLDMARRLGGVIASAHNGGMALADGSHTEAVADGLIEMNAEVLTDYLMPKLGGK